MNEAERKRRYQAYLLQQNINKPLKVSAQPEPNKVSVQPTQPQNFKVRVSPSLDVQKKATVVTPYSPSNFLENQPQPEKTSLISEIGKQTGVSQFVSGLGKAFLPQSQKDGGETTETRLARQEQVQTSVAKRGGLPKEAMDSFKGLAPSFTIGAQNKLIELVNRGASDEEIIQEAKKIRNESDKYQAKKAAEALTFGSMFIGGSGLTRAATTGGVKAVGKSLAITGAGGGVGGGAYVAADKENATVGDIIKGATVGAGSAIAGAGLLSALGIAGKLGFKKLRGAKLKGVNVDAENGAVSLATSGLATTAAELAGATDTEIIKKILTKRFGNLFGDDIEDVAALIAKTDTPDGIIAVLEDTATMKIGQKATELPTATPQEPVKDDIATQIAKTKSPEQIREAVDALFPTLTKEDADSLATQLAKTAKVNDVKELIKQAEIRSSQIKQTTQEAMPTGQPIDQATAQQQAIQEAAPPVAPAQVTQEPPVTQEVPTTAPKAVEGATTADNVPGSVETVVQNIADANEAIVNANKQTFGQKVKGIVARQWDPRAEANKLDKEYEKIIGRKLNADEKLGEAVRASANSKNTSAQYINDSELKAVVQKYGVGTEAEREFNFYRIAMHDLERRADGRQPITEHSTEDLLRWAQDLEAKYPGIRNDLISLSQGFTRRLQALAVNGPDAFVSSDDMARTALKKDGTLYEFYTPTSRVMPEGVARPEVTAKNVGSISRQQVLQELDKTGNDVELSFDSLERYSDVVHKQLGQARVARILGQRIENGLGGRFIQTADEFARLKAYKQNLQELRDVSKSLEKTISKRTKQAKKFEKGKLATSEKKVVDAAKQEKMRVYKETVASLKAEISKAKVKLKVQKAKAGLPKYKQQQAETQAVTTARDELRKTVNDPDAEAVISNLSRDDLIEVFQAMGNDAPIPNGVWSKLKKLNVTRQQYDNFENIVSGQKQQIEDLKTKLSNVVTNDTSRESIKTMTNEDLVNFIKNVVDNDRATPAQKLAYERYVKNNAKYADMLEDLEYQRMDAEALDSVENGIRSEIAELAPDPTTGKQIIRGLDSEGNKFTMEVPPDLARLLQGIEWKGGNITKAGRILTAPLRMAWTGILNPAFIAKSAIWNAAMVPITSPRGFKIYAPSAIKAGLSALDNSSEFQRMLTANAANRYGSDFHKLVSDNTIEAISGNKDKLKFYNPVTPKGFARSWGLLNEVGGKIDQIYRSAAAKAEYDNVINNGGTVQQAEKAASEAYSTVLPDYANVSQQIKAIDAWIPYTAASEAGTRTFFRALKNNPKKNAAILGMYASVGASIYAYSMSNNSGKEFYEDMKKSGRLSSLDGYAVLVLPGASKNEETGEWDGVFKVPVPPEVRAINRAIREGFAAAATGKGVDPMVYARSAFDFMTGGAFTQPKAPVLDIGASVISGTNVATGAPVREPNATTGEAITQTLDYLRSQLGTMGKVLDDPKNGTQAIKDSFVNIFYGAKGEKDAQKYFRYRDEALGEVKLNSNQLDTFNGVIAPRSKDLEDRDIKDKSFYDTSARAQAWLKDLTAGDGKLWEVSKKIAQKQKAEGKPTDPLFDLSGQQLITVLGLMANPSPGNYEEKAIQQLNPWIKDFYKKRGEYFDGIFGGEASKDYTGVTIPKADKQLQAKITSLDAMNGAQKAQFLKDNTDIADYFAAQSAYQRYKRSIMGLPQFDQYPEANPEVQSMMNEYNALPKGEGPAKKDGTASSPARSAWIKANPEKWAAMTEQWYKQNLYNLQGEAALAVYEGIDISQKGLDNIDRISQYQQGGAGGLRFGSGRTRNLANLDELLAGVSVSGIKPTPVIDTTPRKVKFKVKLPGSSKGRSYKKIRLQ